MLNKFLLILISFLFVSCATRKTSLVVNDDNRDIITEQWLKEHNKALVYLPFPTEIQWKNITTNNPEDDIFMYGKRGGGDFFIVTPGVYVLENMNVYVRGGHVICITLPGIVGSKISYYAFNVKEGDILYLGGFFFGRKYSEIIHVYHKQQEMDTLKRIKHFLPKIEKPIKIIEPTEGKFLYDSHSYTRESATFYNPCSIGDKIEKEIKEGKRK